MEQIFLDTIENYKLIEKNDTILIGFSGGMDSACLLDLLVKIRDDYNLKLIGCHFNHQVRAEAKRDEDFCKKRCEDLNIEFYSASGSMVGFARENKISEEAAGRILRKNFFNDILKKTGANKIALAHNYNDQVETLLLRIFRGTGLDGLRGMDYKDGNIIRPILNIKRADIEIYIKENKIPYVEDHTNFENAYERNKIRNLIIPYIEESLDKEISDQVFNLSTLAKNDVAFLEELTEVNFLNLCKKDGLGNIIVNAEEYLKLDKALRYRLVRRIYKDLSTYIKDISYKNIISIDELFLKTSGKFIDNLGDIKIRKSYNQVIFEKNPRQEILNNYIILKEGINNVNEKLKIKIEKTNKKSAGKNYFTLAVESISGPLVIRTRENGDRIRPKGLNGSKKLKDIFIDKKIDRAKRDSYLLLADNEKIFAIIDLVKSKYLYDDSKSGTYVLVSIEKEEDKHA